MKHGFGGQTGRFRSVRHTLRLVRYCLFAICLAYPGLPDTPVFIKARSLTPASISICAIQGYGDISPYAGQLVSTSGVVYADFEALPAQGIYLQHEGCDGDSSTSDGIFVYLADGSDTLQSGDYVEVSGTVQEYHGQTEINSHATAVQVATHSNPLPTPVELAPPQENQAAGAYLESLEGMHIRMEQARVVGPTDSRENTWVVNARLGIHRLFNDDPQGTGAILRVSSQGAFQITPKAKVSDLLVNIQGALDGTDNLFTLHLVEQPTLYPGDLPQQVRVQPLGQGFTLATFNLANLFDSLDDLQTDDTVLTATEYQRRLEKRALTIHEMLAEPDILVVQEAENNSVLLALVNRPEIEEQYDIVWEDGPDPRGLDIALLYHHDRVELLGYQVMQGCTGLIDGLGPDGNGDVQDPANSLTCDLDGDDVLDGNHLFSRPPLVVKLRVVSGELQNIGALRTTDLTVIANHWKSKIQDSAEVQYTLPRRIKQAQFVAGLVQSEISRGDSDHIIVAGDLNDTPNSEPVSILKSTGLRDLTQDIEWSSRYSMIYQGVSQVLDYVLEMPTIQYGAAQVEILHINADFPVVFGAVDGIVFRSSDHDPVWGNMIQFSSYVFFPQILHEEQLNNTRAPAKR